MTYISKSLSELNEYITTINCLIVTATDVETSELHKQLLPIEGTSIYRLYQGNFTYYIGQFGKIRVVHVQSGMGSIASNASIVTISAALNQWKPKAVIMVGIAFGKDSSSQKIGDVLISETIIPYNIQKIGTQKAIQRGPVPPAGTVLINRFKNGVKDWYHELPEGQRAKAHFGGILSGESLVDNREYRDKLLEDNPTAIGGEMEGAGLFAAASQYNVEWILVKGICDFADGNKSTNKHVYQQLAIESSVSLCNHICSVPTIFDALGINTCEHIDPVTTTKKIDSLNKVVFDVYSPDKEEYYLYRKSDQKFTAYLDAYSIWISGKSGCGKTTLILRNLYKTKRDFKFINMVHCDGFSVPEVFVEIFQQLKDILDCNDDASCELSKIHKILEGICDLIDQFGASEELVIFMEEIPLPDDAEFFKEFVTQLNALMILNRSKNPNCNLKIVLSSIDSPVTHIKASQNKIHEIFKFFHETDWSDSELTSLIKVIDGGLGINFTDSQIANILAGALGSPRFVKNFIRDFMITSPSSEREFSDLLLSVAHDLKPND